MKTDCVVVKKNSGVVFHRVTDLAVCVLAKQCVRLLRRLQDDKNLLLLDTGSRLASDGSGGSMQPVSTEKHH